MKTVFLNELLRSPAAVVERCHDPAMLRTIGATSLACIAVGGAVFGAVLGMTRGDLQVAYSAAKLPLSVLVTLMLTVPAFHAVTRAVGRTWPLQVTVALGLAGLARFSLVLLALAPWLWLAVDGGASYHGSIVLAALAYAVAFIAALRVVGAGMTNGPGATLAMLSFALILTAAGSQSAWVLRPYIGRPSQIEVPFVRGIEGGFLDSVVTSSDSWSRGLTSSPPGRSH